MDAEKFFFLKKLLWRTCFRLEILLFGWEYFIRSLKTSEFRRRTSYSDVLLKLELEIMTSMWRGHHGRKAPPASRTAARCSYSAAVRALKVQLNLFYCRILALLFAKHS